MDCDCQIPKEISGKHIKILFPAKESPKEGKHARHTVSQSRLGPLPGLYFRVRTFRQESRLHFTIPLEFLKQFLEKSNICEDRFFCV